MIEQTNTRKNFEGFKRSVMLFLSLIFCLLLWEGDAAASSDSFYTMSRRDLVFGMSFDDRNTGVAVGNRGMILRTTNAGVDWAKIDSKTFSSFNDVVLKGNSGWIVGQGGVILHSEDNGRTWAPQQSGIESSLMQVIFLNEVEGIAIGEAGSILKTDDGGNSWVPVEIDWFSVLPESLIEMGVIAPNLYDLFFINGLKGWMVGDYGIVLVTSDGGTTWDLLRAGQLAPLFAVFFVGANEGWAAGQNGLLLHTNDGGGDWKQIDAPTKASLHKMYLCGQEGFVIGDQATILRTCNSGESWSLVDLNIPPPYPWFGDIAVTANSCPTELVIGGSGLIRQVSLSVNLEQ